MLYLILAIEKYDNKQNGQISFFHEELNEIQQIYKIMFCSCLKLHETKSFVLKVFFIWQREVMKIGGNTSTSSAKS